MTMKMASLRFFRSLPPSTCFGCRRSTLGAFTTAFLDAVPVAVAAPLIPASRRRLLRPESRRHLHLSSRALGAAAGSNVINDGESRHTPTTGSAPAEAQAEAPTSISIPPSQSSSTTTSNEPNLPWYLQVDTPTPPTLSASHPLADRHLLPDLPPDPPPILSPTLSYLSLDAGLDHLTLIDLRTLNPPPALGGNLLMILGTARSVKHLNVSANRFCRWLRSTYKLRPYADGLLGRNELKLKLRRKARKAKLAASVGNSMVDSEPEGQVDDGITTGWICVNVGQVENGDEREEGQVEFTPVVRPELEEEEDEDQNQTQDQTQDQTQNQDEEIEEVEDIEDIDDNDDDDDEIQQGETYVGFGSRSVAPRIVVQMLTEDKRAELNLEGLWHTRATRRVRRAAKRKSAR